MKFDNKYKKKAEEMTFDELKKFYEDYQDAIPKEKYEELEEENQEFFDEINDLRDNIEKLEKRIKYYENELGFELYDNKNVLDILKMNILAKAFKEYSIDDLEKRLNLDWLLI